MQINLNPTSERGASRDAVNRPRETLGDSHLISSDPRSRFGLVCDLLCCRGNSRQSDHLASGRVFGAEPLLGDAGWTGTTGITNSSPRLNRLSDVVRFTAQ